MSQKKNLIRDAVEQTKCEVVENALIDNYWHIAKAAEALGVARNTVWRIARKYKLMKPGKVMVRGLVKA